MTSRQSNPPRSANAGATDLAVDEARMRILNLLEPVQGTEQVFIRAALGRVLARDLLASVNVPAHDNSAMDGYALRFDDLVAAGETTLRCIGKALAGHEFGGSVGPGQCVRIMTGGVLPEGADTVVIQEAVRLEGEEITVPTGLKRGQHVRRAGEDLRAGSVALAAGKLIRPAELGLMASLGQVDVAVRRRLRVAFFSTGDELNSLGQPLADGEVYDSNRYTLFGMLSRLGCEPLDLGVVRDQPDELDRVLLQAAAEADVILTTGGVSVGEADFIRSRLARLGEMHFWKIAMRPGKPLVFGRIENAGHSAWLFGLPGNPVAVMVTFYEFVREALLRMMGLAPVPPLPRLQVPSAVALRKRPGRSEFQRGILFVEDGVWKVRDTGQQGSGMLRSMAEANCLICLEEERGPVAVGEAVTVQVFEGLV